MKFILNSIRILQRFLKIISIKNWNSPRISSEFFLRMRWLQKSSRILIRILVASLNIQQFRWLWNSWRIRWSRNSCEILPGIDQNSSRIRWPRKSARILIRILVASLIIQQFWWLWNSSRIRWPRNSCEILPWFDQNSSRVRWPWNYHEYFQWFQSEFW